MGWRHGGHSADGILDAHSMLHSFGTRPPDLQPPPPLVCSATRRPLGTPHELGGEKIVVRDARHFSSYLYSSGFVRIIFRARLLARGSSPREMDEADGEGVGVYESFKRVWRNERCAPALLPFDEELVQTIELQIQAQVRRLPLEACLLPAACCLLPAACLLARRSAAIILLEGGSAEWSRRFRTSHAVCRCGCRAGRMPLRCAWRCAKLALVDAPFDVPPSSCLFGPTSCSGRI